ncbi:hypothetical protein P691DRAFT_775957 [Macrolepiota fuliginosa MF-IS2]|uniref:Uncharacterized protein n=1 Tax=Macrolepiota fuliginosa MF-IS2 TaxID=1400762 RepID=A0A9P6C3P0_9AGAR|nr:hypothetical protein P691DRAFT_775957 [Macrolepiota fuliginosa MF-IS2]
MPNARHPSSPTLSSSRAPVSSPISTFCNMVSAVANSRALAGDHTTQSTHRSKNQGRSSSECYAREYTTNKSTPLKNTAFIGLGLTHCHPHRENITPYILPRVSGGLVAIEATEISSLAAKNGDASTTVLQILEKRGVGDKLDENASTRVKIPTPIEPFWVPGSLESPRQEEFNGPTHVGIGRAFAAATFRAELHNSRWVPESYSTRF